MLLHAFWPQLDAVTVLGAYARGERRLEDAVADGRLPAEQADASAARVARFKGDC